MPPIRSSLLLATAVAALPSLSATNTLAADWPAWRGPTGQGICLETGLPTRWSDKENVKWKAPLPAPGNSTPVVWGHRIFLTQAADKGKDRMTFCLDRTDGSIVWKRIVRFEGPEPTHEDNPYCSASPVTDGERVIVFHGSAGVVSYDLNGIEAWRKDLGELRHIWGNASSPVLHGDRILLNCGPGPRTFLTAIDKQTGETVWKVDIPGGLEDGGGEKWTGSWATPIILRSGDRDEVVIGFPHRLHGYDARTGEVVWSSGGLGRLVYSSPVAGEGAIVALSGFMGPPIAVRAGGKGDVTATHQLWRRDRAPQEIGSGVIADGRLYLVDESGAGECIELLTGKTIWRERVGGHTWSSLVLAEGRIFSIDQAGECTVFRASPTFEVIAKNPVGERTRASIAVSDGEVFIRTYNHLWCIASAASKAR